MTQSSILICTVGGSHQPIVTGILQHRPSFVHFLCSDDAGKLKGSYTQVIGEGNATPAGKRFPGTYVWDEPGILINMFYMPYVRAKLQN